MTITMRSKFCARFILRNTMGALMILAMLQASAVVAGVGNTYFVRTTGNDANDGLTANTAFATIQKAVNSCTTAGNTIYIGKGTYSEMVEIGINNGSLAGSGTANEPNKIIGDYTGKYTGDGAGPVILDGGGTQKYGIYIKQRNGWMIRGIYTKNQLYYSIYSYKSDDLTISNCTIGVPDARYRYGLLIFSGINLRIEDNNFMRTLTSGFPVFVYGTSGRVIIDRNRLALTGADYLKLNYYNGLSYSQQGRYRFYNIVYGIIYLSDFRSLYSRNAPTTTSQVYIQNNVISDTFLGAYAAVFGANDNAYISNNTITGCYYGMYGYALNGNVLLSDNIVTRSYYAGGGYSYKNGNVTIDGLLTDTIKKYPIFYSYKNTIITNNILENTDPMWKDPANGDYSLPIDSPAVDAAVGSYFVADDIRTVARPYNAKGLPGAISDFGAYEFNPTVDGNPRPQLVQWQEKDPDR